ncbi:MAG TPA: hypothetical protein VMU38_10775 [Candidatus Binatia bacterium]|nr:hypothetical protein [Candidatus Binatia bacterium]
MSENGAATASFLATFFFVYAIVIIAIVAFTIWLYWRIFTKAGFNGAISLVNLFPGIGHLVSLLILAFAEWPSQQAGTAANPLDVSSSETGVVPPHLGPGGPGGTN